MCVVERRSPRFRERTEFPVAEGLADLKVIQRKVPLSARASEHDRKHGQRKVWRTAIRITRLIGSGTDAPARALSCELDCTGTRCGPPMRALEPETCEASHRHTDWQTIRRGPQRTAALDFRKPVADVEPRSAVVGFRFSPAQPRRGYGQKSIRPQARRANPQRTIGGVRRVLARGRAVLVCTGGALG
jgi:hypothetical protein